MLKVMENADKERSVMRGKKGRRDRERENRTRMVKETRGREGLRM